VGNFSEAGKVIGTCGKMTCTRTMSFRCCWFGPPLRWNGIGVIVRHWL